ncbi:hypothetical protein [Shewanella sp. TC10]|uniref:hypothetical protein n=1 Tax=Shewanella sp. TC10 TaxID=1419739 RepID=UPI00129E3E42|nr:hypothetical protein [Shewanella sp. TC10]
MGHKRVTRLCFVLHLYWLNYSRPLFQSNPLPAAGLCADTTVTRYKFIPECSAMTSMSWTVTAALTPEFSFLRFNFIRVNLKIKKIQI